MDAAIKKLNIPTKDDIDELNKKIDAILNELNKEQ